MKAMVLRCVCDLSTVKTPLEPAQLPDPVPGDDEVLIRVTACGVCHTELDEIEGRTPPPKLPVVLGHQVVGTIAALGSRCRLRRCGERVGVAWIHRTCGACRQCRAGMENLCDHFSATGRDANGGYATLMTAPEGSVFPIPAAFTDIEAAPLLCAGAIGYRSLRLTGITDRMRLGLTGFGASAHLVLKMARHLFPAVRVFVFARSEGERRFALELGAVWAGESRESAPELLDAVIDTTPAWEPVVGALENLAPGGRLVINAIRKEAADQRLLLELDYPTHLWLEKEIKSVANVQLRDVAEFLDLAARIPIRPEVTTYPLEEANRALLELKERKIRGAKVLVMPTP